LATNLCTPHCGLFSAEIQLTQTTTQPTATAQFSIAAKEMKAQSEGSEKRL